MASTVLAEYGAVKVYDSYTRSQYTSLLSFRTFSKDHLGKNWFRYTGSMAGRIVVTVCMQLLFLQLLLLVMILLRSNSTNLP